MMCKMKQQNKPAMLDFLLDTAEDSCIVNDAHALAVPCNTAFPNHSQFCTLATNKTENDDSEELR